MVIEPIRSGNWEKFKEVRLRALQDAPMAFGSTYAREVAMTDAEWAARVERWNGVRGVGFLAMNGAAGCGMAGALVEGETEAQLVSMWTAPECRRAGVGRMLVDAVTEWAAKKGLQRVTLKVTSKNDGAMVFYERMGFVRTGRVTPWPNGVEQAEFEMEKLVG